MPVCIRPYIIQQLPPAAVAAPLVTRSEAMHVHMRFEREDSGITDIGESADAPRDIVQRRNEPLHYV